MSVELPNHQEIAKIAGYAAVLPEAIVDSSHGSVMPWDIEWATVISCAPREPWLHIIFEPKPPYPADAGIERVELYLWRFSLDVYQPDEDGAVGEDPITPEEFARELAARG
jgi:hypothetical protein